jgi:hypothetical protein
MSNDKPVFVIGNPRSGTTMLRLILTSNSKLSIPPEAAFIVKYFSKYGHLNKFNLSSVNSFMKHLQNSFEIENRWEVSFKEYHEKWLDNQIGKSYPDVCASIYRYYAYKKYFGKENWGDKNTSHRNYIDVLSWLFPHAQFVHIIRDSRSVFASYKTLPRIEHKYAPKLTKDPLIFSAHWLEALDRIEYHAKKYAPGRYITVRYEDVVKDFERTIKKVCNFLNLEYEENMLNFNEINEKYNLEPKSYDKWKWRTRKPLTDSRIDNWKNVLDKNEIRTINFLTSNKLIRYGYNSISSRNQKKPENFTKLHRNLIIKRRFYKFREIMRSLRFYSILFKNKLWR